MRGGSILALSSIAKPAISTKKRVASLTKTLASAAILLSVFPSVAWPADRDVPQQKPNVIVILADDLGKNDLSIDGNPYVSTPNMDSIARDGARFATGYASDAICAPSRAGLLTGRDPERFGFEFLPYGPKGFPDMSDSMPGYAPMILPPHLAATPAQDGLSPKELTIAALLKMGGYHTGAIGKWHLGTAPVLRPLQHGFDEYVGFLGGASLYADPDDPDVIIGREPWAGRDALNWKIRKYQLRRNNDGPQPAKGYMTDVLTDEAVGFIDRNAKKPFFLYLAYNAPHEPLQAPKAIYDKLGVIKDENTRIYYAMVESLDMGVGRVLDELKKQGLDKNTLIFLVSDNGAAPLSRTRNRISNLPYRGSKMTYFEGGLNVPFFVQWPAKIKAGTVLRGPASELDILPTIMAAAGASLPTDRVYDGIDLMPVLTGADPNDLDKRPPLVWRKEHYYAVRDGQYMLQVSQYPKKIWLYDLERDPTERINLADQMPDVVARLKAIFAKRATSYIAPLWGPSARSRVDIDGASDLGDLNQEHVYWAN
jgi:arylsulfatase A-like enzyme